MKHFWVIALVVLAASLGMANCVFADAQYSSPATAHPPKDPAAAAAKKSVRMANHQLAKNVRKALTQAGDVDVSHMTVSAWTGAVTLGGSVPEEDQIQLAEQHASEVTDVTKVTNRLAIATRGR